ncbi:MAG TPA: ECF-type sigma factor [Isosphaeraceae bacterium]|jgi:DNA-directed RNA polymerase specialized sigma24 family protein
MDDAGGGSVTSWIGGLKGGDPQAAHHLWHRYVHRLVALARAQLGRVPRTDADEEDVALIACHALGNGANQGSFDRLGDRDDLWRLLVVIVARKAADQKTRHGRLKRGGGKVLNESVLDGDDSEGAPASLEQIAARDPTPAFAAMLAEEYQRRLDALGDDTLRRVALPRLEGYDGDEIAARLGCARRTVVRKLAMIRDAWNRDAT